MGGLLCDLSPSAFVVLKILVAWDTHVPEKMRLSGVDRISLLNVLNPAQGAVRYAGKLAVSIGAKS